MDISECDTSLGWEHKMKKRKLEQFDNAPEDNNTGSVNSGSEDASSMDNILLENDLAPDATFIICSKLESETGQIYPEICNSKGNVHEKDHDGDQILLKDMDTGHGNVNGYGNLILNTAVVKQNVARYSVEMEKPCSTDAYEEDPRISEDPGDMRDHDDHENEHDGDQKVLKDMVTEHENINGSGNLILTTEDVKQNVARNSVETKEPSSMNAYEEDPRISEDTSGMRNHDDHEEERDDDQKLLKDTDTEHENINGSGNLILNTVDVKQKVARYSVEMEKPSSMDSYEEDPRISVDPGGMRDHYDHENEHDGDQKVLKDMVTGHENINGSGNVARYSVEVEEPSSTNAYEEDPRISEDPGGKRDHDDHRNVANVSQELSKEVIDVRKDDHSREKSSDSDYQLPCNEQEYKRDGSLKSSDIEQINGACGNNASEKIVEGAVVEVSVFCSVGDHDDETLTSKERIMSTPSCMPPELENAETLKEEVVCFSTSGETSSGVNAIIEETTPSQVFDTEKGDSIGHSRKKLVVLDVNGLLADFISYVPYGYKPDIIIGPKAVFKRPFCDDFIKFCFERFEVGVWSSRTRRNVDMVIDFLMGDFRPKLLFCWDQSHCTDTTFSTVENKQKPLVLKEIKKLWKYLKPREFNASNTLLLDDSPHKALCNPANTAIFPVTYRFRDTDDTSLGPGGDLRMYLKGLSEAENVQKYVEQHRFGQRPITEKNPSWKFYRRIIYFVERQNDPADTNSFKWN